MSASNEFNEWLPIFRGGIRKDTLGREHDGDRVIDRIIQSFNPSHHEPPLTIGEVKDNSPAFGWVKALKTLAVNGQKTLFAKFGQLYPALTKDSRNRARKRFAVSIYKDGRLRRVALEGVTPPHMPVLENVNHNHGGKGMTFEFDEKDKQFDPGVILEGKIQEILRNPPKTDEYGKPYRAFGYRDAMTIAIKENAELGVAYLSRYLPERETIIS